MARPTKAAATTVGHFTSGELKKRMDSEAKLKGESDKLKPPSYLTISQKKIFRYIMNNLKSSGILGNLDVYVLTECSICIDRMQTIEKKINESDIFDPMLVSIKEKYTKAFFRYCNELSLSPQSRAKLANINTQSKEENPLIKALMSDD
ncbi:MAG: P27 family phage terminase small subunit [Ruminococcus flavefaciens]|nr:P27 family phage terminase small subunit [Ruminococcus flavefaciens]MCM1061471.1 P27 family phage terminase small subunit [Eubacterium sp.]